MVAGNFYIVLCGDHARPCAHFADQLDTHVAEPIRDPDSRMSTA
jgi:hypothetical protein